MPGRRSHRSLVLTLAVAACAEPARTPETASSPPADVAAVRDAIQAREKEWSAAFLGGNATGVAALYTEDGAQVQASGDWFRGRDAIAKAMQAQFDTLAVTAREDITEEVFPAGDYVVEIGHYSYQGTSKASKKPVSGAGRYMVLWRKDADGAWRIHRDIGNDAAPAKL